MSLIQDSLNAAECLERLQGLLREKGDQTRDEEISSIICLLESPLLHQLLVLQDSIQELQQVNDTYRIGKDDFDFLSSGELVLSQQHQEPSQDDIAESSMQNLPIATSGYNQEIQRFAEKAARGREMETIQLFKPEKSSLGFSVVGLKTDSGEMGIFVKDIQPNGIASRDGRLQEKDQILVIDGQPLDISHQEAIRILQSARGLVELIVARGLIPPSTPDQPRKDIQELEATHPQQENSDMVLNTEWTQIEEIELINDGTGLGFGIIGGRSTGVVVKTILPGGVADSDGRLHSGDHILQIGDVNVRAMGSEQVAAVLRQAGSHVRLIVARPVIDDPSLMPLPQAPIVPTLRLDEHLQRLNNLIIDSPDIALNGPNIPEDVPVISMDPTMNTSLMLGMLEHNAQIHPVPVPHPYVGPTEYPEVEYFDVELVKDIRQGLGITIAGYVGRDNTPDDLCGIFVKSIAEGSAAGLNGRIQVNDQIIEVDGQSLHGYTNHQAVEVLRKTGQVVKLKLVRYQHGAKFERLQLYLSQPPGGQQQPPVLPTTQVFTSVEVPSAPPLPPYEPSNQEQQRQVNIEDVNVMSMEEEDFDGELSPDMEAAIQMGWEPIVGDDFEIVVAQLSKFKEGGGLGISLEGTVDVENGIEVRPHHYIRSILPNGPVGVNKRLRSGDELLEVNGKRLLGLNHKEVVGILKDLPQYVRLVCARRKTLVSETYGPPEAPYFPSDFNVGVTESQPILTKAKSEMDIPTSEPTVHMGKRSRSLEPLTGLAMWSSEPVVIELSKGDKGLGFSILDYQDPANPSETVIVIRSLVPGGVAQQDGRLVPGDRLIFVNDVNLETATLDEAVQTLKGAPKGLVQIGVAKPLPLSEAFQDQSNSNSLESQQTIKPSPREPPVSKKRTTVVKKAPPPVPPKPAHLIGSPGKGKDEPPPLPVSSPPPLLPIEMEIKTPPIVPSSQGMNENLDSSFSSVTDHFTTSDLKAASSPSSTLRTSSPGMSPLSSPVLMRSLSGGADVLPSTLEKVIKLKKSHDQLGLSVEAAEKGVNGCIVTNIAKNGAIDKEGSIQVGDYITSVNNESMRRITNAQARAILRRASLLGSIDMSISYIPSADAAVYRETASTSTSEYSPTKTMMPSPKIFPKYYRSTLSPLLKTESSSTDGGSEPSSPSRRVLGFEDGTPESSPQHKLSPSSPLKNRISEGIQTWGPPRTVKLLREPGKSLGISIVGGKADIFRTSKENAISGIFIKHVLEDSPAGRNGTLKTGDRILEVDGKDLRNATHDQAVEIIRNAKSPVTFVVQSLGDPVCPRDSDIDRRSVQSYDESPSQQNLWTAPSQTQATEETTTAEPQVEDVDEYGYSIERIQRQYGGDLNEGELHLVEFLRGNGGLGLSLAGNKDRSKMSVFVAGIQPDSIVARDGQIQVGDELLEVNGHVLVGRSHLNASSIIKGLQTPTVKIVLRRRPDFIEHMAVKPLTVSPKLLKDDKTGLGTEPITISTKSDGKSPLSSPISMHDVIQVIDLNKGPAGLGFAIVEDTKDGCQGIYVRSITTGGVASQNGNLSVGDQILEVADKPLIGVPYDKAIEILRNVQGTVKLKVRKVGADNILKDSSSSQNIQLLNVPGESSTDPPTESGTNETPDDESVDPLTCPIIPGKETVIEIEKGRTGLGLSIVGGADTLLGAIIIHEVYEDGAAAKDGRLWAGDQVLEVGDENLREASHDYAIQVLRQTPSRVRIVVFRDDTQVKDEDIYDIFTVELMKKPGKGLGLSIVGKRNDVGVYISDIVKGGVAEADGRLMQGDQIMSVNGEDMKNSTQEYAAAVLKTLQKKVTLTVGRLKAGSKTSSRRNSNSPGTALKKSESSASNKSRGGRHSKSVSEDASHIRTVELTFDSSGSLGLSIAGGIGSSLGDSPVMIANMSPTGPAAKSQKLKIGDKIININGVSIEGMRHEQVIQLLKASAEGTVTLQVTQGEQTPVSISGRSSRQVSMDLTPELLTPAPQDSVFDNEDDGPPPTCNTIVLERGPEGLGFSIVGGHGSPHGDLPIYVKNVFSKGAAAENGQLKRGDQILSVNGQSLEGCTHEEAVNILKNAKGTVTLNVLS
ncbi:hypothetical protein ACJMK2_042565 [Sinanodonta woodiana]|uniref:Multiple PDZ domain protein n=2 Tax=Sinanodonta woodiana TaxID=1069815 RepID=A0ABD3W7Q8_SINWO